MEGTPRAPLAFHGSPQTKFGGIEAEGRELSWEEDEDVSQALSWLKKSK